MRKRQRWSVLCRPLTEVEADTCDVGQSRPFGVALLIAGVDQHGPQLSVPLQIDAPQVAETALAHRYHADPSGTFMRYDAKAIGSGSEGAQNELQDSYNKVSFAARLSEAPADL